MPTPPRFDLTLGGKMVGDKALVASFRARASRVTDRVRDAVGESAAFMAQRVIDLCPKDTFYMSEHVRTDFAEDDLSFETGWDAKDFLGTTLDTGAPRPFYPPYVEFGTRHMRAQPTLAIAFAEEVPRFQALIADAVREGLR